MNPLNCHCWGWGGGRMLQWDMSVTYFEVYLVGVESLFVGFRAVW